MPPKVYTEFCRYNIRMEGPLFKAIKLVYNRSDIMS